MDGYINDASSYKSTNQSHSSIVSPNVVSKTYPTTSTTVAVVLICFVDSTIRGASQRECEKHSRTNHSKGTVLGPAALNLCRQSLSEKERSDRRMVFTKAQPQRD